VLVVGVNGAGKTTSVAKLGNFWRKAGRNVLLAAADTFRAAGTEQLEIWAERARLACVRGQQGGDPGAVIFDAISAARARGMDLVVADTAGRLHTKINLMEELGKLSRIAARQEVPVHSLLVLDATTGQNGIAQARGFREAVGLSGIVLSKLDGTAKGGAVFSIVREFGAPVLFAGTGEQIEDLAEFNPEKFVEALFAE
jgi:fused signal recognition particle receptor